MLTKLLTTVVIFRPTQIRFAISKEFPASGEILRAERSPAKTIVTHISAHRYRRSIHTKLLWNDEDLLNPICINECDDHKPAYFLENQQSPSHHGVLRHRRNASVDNTLPRLWQQNSKHAQSRHTDSTYLKESLRGSCTQSYAPR